MKRLPLSKGMRVLDVGCGPGRFVVKIAEQIGPEGEVVAVDIQPEMLRIAEKKVKDLGLGNVRFRETDVGAGEGTFEKDHYDLAIMVAVLGEIPEKNRTSALKVIYEALKPNGLLSNTEIKSDPHFLEVETVRHLADGTGLKEISYFRNWLTHTITFAK